jgi:hypothetical protein
MADVYLIGINDDDNFLLNRRIGELEPMIQAYAHKHIERKTRGRRGGERKRTREKKE